MPARIAASPNGVVVATDRRLIVVSGGGAGEPSALVHSFRFGSVREVRLVGSDVVEVDAERARISFTMPRSHRTAITEYLQSQHGVEVDPSPVAREDIEPLTDAARGEPADDTSPLSLEQRTARLRKLGVKPNPESNGVATALFVVGFIVGAVLTWVVDVGPWAFGIAWVLAGASFIVVLAGMEDTESAVRREELAHGLETAPRQNERPRQSGLGLGLVSGVVGIIILSLVIGLAGTDDDRGAPARSSGGSLASSATPSGWSLSRCIEYGEEIQARILHVGVNSGLVTEAADRGDGASAVHLWDRQIEPSWRWLDTGIPRFEQNCQVHAPSAVDVASSGWRDELRPALRNAEKRVDELRAALR